MIGGLVIGLFEIGLFEIVGSLDGSLRSLNLGRSKVR